LDVKKDASLKETVVLLIYHAVMGAVGLADLTLAPSIALP
jgi:hypothetical protein